MGTIDYRLLEEKMIKKIAGIRAEYCSKNNNIGDEVLRALNSKVFNYRTANHSNYEFVNESVDQYVYEILEKIIVTLFVERKIPVSTGFTMNTSGGQKNVKISDLFQIYKNAPLFSLIKIEDDKPVLYMFKNYGLNKRLPDSVIHDAIVKLGINDFHYVSLVEECAYSEIVNHSEDDTDSTRGTNAYSLRDFMINNFGEIEYSEFKQFVVNMNDLISDCLGYSVVKTLTPNALFSFKKEIEKSIIEYPYEKSVVVPNGITEVQLKTLKAQYIGNKHYMAVLSEGDFNARFNVEGCQFAESFITSEWLYQSIKEAGKVDLTAIAMGYFKSIEQMLYVFTFAHVGENKWIDTHDRPDNWKDISNKERKWQSPVNANSVKNKKKYIMLERMINFLNDYDDLFKDISTRDYLVERLYGAQQLRNGYFHKDNLSENEKVERAREDAYVIYLLLFGSIKTSEQSKSILGIPNVEIQFDMLCDYMDCNCTMSYYFEEDGEIVVALGQHDEGITYTKDGKATYTGVYMNKLVGISSDTEILTLDKIYTIEKQKISFDKNSIPAKIYKGTFITCKEGILISGPKQLIWDNGILVMDNL